MSAGTAAQNSGPTAQTTNLNNKKPFSYEQYVARKRGIQHALEIKSKKWNLPKNFAKFELQEKTNLSTRDLLNLVINAIGKDNESSIKSFSPGQTSSCWLIAFDSKETKERILHSSPTIMDQIKIVDANEKCPPPVVTCNGKFRLHKLPPYTQLATIEDYLKNKIKIKSFSYKNIQKEKYKDTNIENGIVSFQMSYSLEDHSQVQVLIGANFITNELFSNCVAINPNAISAKISVTTQKTVREKISNVITAREEDMPMQTVILPIEPNMLSTTWTTTMM
jgi:hypothetical protein